MLGRTSSTTSNASLGSTGSKGSCSLNSTTGIAATGVGVETGSAVAVGSETLTAGVVGRCLVPEIVCPVVVVKVAVSVLVLPPASVVGGGVGGVVRVDRLVTDGVGGASQPTNDTFTALDKMVTGEGCGEGVGEGPVAVDGGEETGGGAKPLSTWS